MRLSLVGANKVSGGFVPSYSSRPRHNRWTESWKLSLTGTLFVTLPVFYAAQVSLAPPSEYCFIERCLQGVVHAVAYSLLLLNTDLHVAELQTRMSRNQFVRNTLSAIQMQLQSNSSNSDLDANSVRQGSDCISSPRRTKRSDSITSWNSITRDGIMSLGASLPAAANGTNSGNGSTSSFPASNGESKSPEPVVAVLYDRAWESEMETMLKVERIHKLEYSALRLSRKCTRRSSTSKCCNHSGAVWLHGLLLLH
jgi:hypothetical protein